MFRQVCLKLCSASCKDSLTNRLVIHCHNTIEPKPLWSRILSSKILSLWFHDSIFGYVIDEMLKSLGCKMSCHFLSISYQCAFIGSRRGYFHNYLHYIRWKYCPIILYIQGRDRGYSMTQLSSHTFAHLTGSSFRLKAKLLPNKKILGLKYTWVNSVKKWPSF